MIVEGKLNLERGKGSSKRKTYCSHSVSPRVQNELSQVSQAQF